jgi:hypothetical protein
MNPASASETHAMAIAERFDIFLLARPSITTPAMGSANGSHGERLSARRRNCVPVSVFGPTVATVIETAVPVGEDVPAAIDGGVKTQLLFVSVESAGAKAQLKFTAPAKADPEAGVARNV